MVFLGAIIKRSKLIATDKPLRDHKKEIFKNNLYESFVNKFICTNKIFALSWQCYVVN